MQPFVLIESEDELLKIIRDARAEVARGRTQNAFTSPDLGGQDHVWNHIPPELRIKWAYVRLNELNPDDYPLSALRRARRTVSEVYQC